MYFAVNIILMIREKTMWAWNSWGRIEVCRRFYWAEGKMPHERPSLRQEATMEMNIKEIV